VFRLFLLLKQQVDNLLHQTTQEKEQEQEQEQEQCQYESPSNEIAILDIATKATFLLSRIAILFPVSSGAKGAYKQYSNQPVSASNNSSSSSSSRNGHNNTELITPVDLCTIALQDMSTFLFNLLVKINTSAGIADTPGINLLLSNMNEVSCDTADCGTVSTKSHVLEKYRLSYFNNENSVLFHKASKALTNSVLDSISISSQ
jgi:hypothetical protein